MLTTGPSCHDYGIRGYGDPSDGVVLVGIAPGRDEIERTKRPFTGASGRLLDDLLKFSGWSRERIYTTNVICWWNNTPTEDEMDLCGERFRREVRAMHPRLIVTAGALPNQSVTGAKRRKGSRGSVTWSPYWQSYILDTHHPSYALQAQSMDAVQDIIRDLSKIPDILNWPTDAASARVTHTTVETLADAQAVLDNLPAGQIVALDIETSNPDLEAIDAFTDQLLCFVVSYDVDGREHNVVFPKRLFPQCVRDGSHVRAWRTHGGCPACELPPEALRFPLSPRWTFQAGQNDIVGLAVYFGVTLPLCEDTMLMSYCADERPGYHSLKPLAREYLGGVGWYEAPVKPFYKGKMHLLSDETVETYNAHDGAYTKRLVPVLWRKVVADGTNGLYRNILVPAMDTFTKMQIRGINVDQARLQQLAYDEWFPRYVQMYRDLQLEAQEIGWLTDDINFNSTPQLRKFFYNILGLDVTKLTKSGKPSLDKETLDRMDHPFAAKLRAYRQLDGIIDYVLAVYAHLKWDGLLHPSGYVSTTRTGRTSYRDPAMQTIPKDYTVGADYARLREIIVPHNPETHCLIEADYNQIEVWLAWAFSKDPVLLKHLESGDVHSATAELAFNTFRTDWSPAEWQVKRQNAKKIRFGLQYGEGPEKLASPPPVGIGGTVTEARRFILNYRRSYPVYTQWMLDIQREAQDKGYLRLPSGRVMRFPVIMDHKQLRQAINFPIQGVASEYNLTSMIELYPLLAQYNSHIILNVHDNLTVETDRRYVPEVAALIRDIMEKPRFPGFPSVKVDIKIGDSLGNMVKYKP